LTKAAGGGATAGWLVLALGCTASGVASPAPPTWDGLSSEMAWSMLITPETYCATEAGTDRLRSWDRSVWPFTLYSPRLTPNAFCTWSTVPVAST
jgi:hypothetical protein